MESYQTIIMAECVAKERRERAQSAAEQWYLTDRDAPQAGLREAMAGMLISLAQWIAPQHAALGVQHR
jgi:hypothetical protein